MDLFFGEIICALWWYSVLECVVDLVIDGDGGVENVVDELLEFVAIDAFSEQRDGALRLC